MKESLQEAVEEQAEMNMTPMIDVVFLLIIFFLCIDFRILEAKLPAWLPEDVGTHSTDVEPQEKLQIEIVCSSRGEEVPRYTNLTEGDIAAGKQKSYFLKDHIVHWRVGPRRFDELKKLKTALTKIFNDPSKLQRDPKTNEMKPMSVVVEPGVATVYNDVARTVDAVRAAGFEDITFGGGRGKGNKG
ncbi:MAG: biopolymer transporter ExbD [Planctomycetota bacterium]